MFLQRDNVHRVWEYVLIFEMIWETNGETKRWR